MTTKKFRIVDGDEPQRRQHEWRLDLEPSSAAAEVKQLARPGSNLCGAGGDVKFFFERAHTHNVVRVCNRSVDKREKRIFVWEDLCVLLFFFCLEGRRVHEPVKGRKREDRKRKERTGWPSSLKGLRELSNFFF